MATVRLSIRNADVEILRTTTSDFFLLKPPKGITPQLSK